MNLYFPLMKGKRGNITWLAKTLLTHVFFRLCLFKVPHANAGSKCHCRDAQQYYDGGLLLNYLTEKSAFSVSSPFTMVTKVGGVVQVQCGPGARFSKLLITFWARKLF